MPFEQQKPWTQTPGLERLKPEGLQPPAQMDDRRRPEQAPTAPPLQMGDRVQYVSGGEHPALYGQRGIILRTTGDDATIQMDDGTRILVGVQGLHKLAMIGDDALIEDVANEVFEGDVDSEFTDVPEPDADEQRAVYHGEDRDVTPAPGESAQTTAASGTHVFTPKKDPTTTQPHCKFCGQMKSHENHHDEKTGEPMNVESKWNVIALGELQQPGGVGATMGLGDPAGDPIEPDMSYHDNAENGYEQEVALKHWVDTAVDMLNRGESEELILAKLSHDGCPEPEIVLQRAIEQPEKEPDDMPVTDEPLSQPLQAPAGQAPESDTAMSIPQGVSARVTVRGLPATVLGSFTGQWEEEVVRVAFDNGKTMDVRPSDIEAVAEAVDEPVQTVQEFIDSFPPVNDNHRSSIDDRIANIKTARNKIATLVQSDVEERQRIALDAMDVHLHRELNERIYELRHFATDADLEYVKSQPRFEMQAVEQESMGHGHKSPYFLDDEVADQSDELANTDFEKIVSEDSAIMVSELPQATLSDIGQVHQMAASYIDQRTAGLADDERAALRGRFVEAAFDEREKRLAQIDEESDEDPVEETATDFGPAESLFLR